MFENQQIFIFWERKYCGRRVACARLQDCSCWERIAGVGIAGSRTGSKDHRATGRWRGSGTGGSMELAGEVIGAGAASACRFCRRVPARWSREPARAGGARMHIDEVSRWTRKRAAFIGAGEL